MLEYKKRIQVLRIASVLLLTANLLFSLHRFGQGMTLTILAASTVPSIFMGLIVWKYKAKLKKLNKPHKSWHSLYVSLSFPPLYFLGGFLMHEALSLFIFIAYLIAFATYMCSYLENP